MNKTIIRTLLVCIGIPLAFFFLSFISQPRASDIAPELGLAFSLAGLFYIVPGIILALIKSSRDVGKEYCFLLHCCW